MRGTLHNVRRWLWLPAVACGVAGVCGLADLRDAAPAGKLLMIGPHAVGAALAAWTGRRRAAAGMVAVAGSALMAGLSWIDALDRRTEGFEWQFDNALSGAMCLGANYCVLPVVGCISLYLADPDESATGGFGSGRGTGGSAHLNTEAMAGGR